MGGNGRAKPLVGARDHPPAKSLLRESRQVLALVVGEGRFPFLLLFRKGDPGLDAVDVVALAARTFKPFAMGDPAPGGHPVDFPRADGLLGGQAVSMHDLAGEKVGDGGQANVGVRQDVHALRTSSRQLERPHAVEEDERADHAALRPGQKAPHVKTSKASLTLRNDKLKHGPILPRMFRAFPPRGTGRRNRQGSFGLFELPLCLCEQS